MLVGKRQRGKLLGRSRNRWKYNTKMKFWGIHFRCVKLTEVAYLMIHQMAADFLHEFKVVVFQYLIDACPLNVMWFVIVV